MSTFRKGEDETDPFCLNGIPSIVIESIRISKKCRLVPQKSNLSFRSTVGIKNSDFQTILINSKKIQKNVKFGLQAHLNI